MKTSSVLSELRKIRDAVAEECAREGTHHTFASLTKHAETIMREHGIGYAELLGRAGVTACVAEEKEEYQAVKDSQGE